MGKERTLLRQIMLRPLTLIRTTKTMATMKPIASSLSTTLLLAVAVLGSTTVDAASKPWSQDSKTTTTTTTVEATGTTPSKDSNDVKGYLLFRQESDCNDDHSADGGHTEYDDHGHDGDGYLPYPGGNRNRRRALRAPRVGDENAIGDKNEQQQHLVRIVRNLEEGKKKCSKSSKKGSATKSSKGSKLVSKSKSSKKSAWVSDSDFPGWYDDPNYSPSSSTYIFPSPSTTPGTPTNGGVDEWGDSTHDGIGDGYGNYPTESGYGTYPSSPNYTPITAPTSSTSGIATTPSPTKANLAGPKSTEIATFTSNCDALTNDEVVRTLHFARLRYTYEAVIDGDATIESVVTGLEDKLSKFVGRDLMECDDDDNDGNENNGRRRRRVLQSTTEIRQHQENNIPENRRRRLEGWEIVGVNPSLPEDKLSETKYCTYFADGSIGTENCYVIEGGMTLYTSVVDDNEGTGGNSISSNNDNNPWENTLRSVLKERTKYALILIMDAMNNEEGDNEDRRSPFLQDHGGYYSVPGLKDVRFHTGSTQDGDDIDASSTSDDDGGSRGSGGLAKASVQSSNNLDTVGYSLMGVGLTALVALFFAFVILRKRSQDGDDKNESYNKFDDDADWEEDDDDDDRKTELVSVVSSHDDLSLSVSPTRNTMGSSSPESQERTEKKVAYVVGEEGSEYTNGNYSTLSYDVSQYLHNAHSHSSSFESENGNDDDGDYERQVDVHFVSAMEDEVGIQSTISTRRRESSYRKEKKVPSSPKFDNPAGIERPYVVGDTVDF